MKDEGVNRAMLLTPPGSAAIAVVRIRGPLVGEFLSNHFSKPVQPHQCVHGTLADGDRTIDDPVVVLHDDHADINLHGGEWVVRECLSLAERAGYRIVESDSDLLDGSTLIEREMLEALPSARTEQSIRLLLDQPRQWAEFLRTASSIGKPDLQVRVNQILADCSLWSMLNPPKIAIIGIPNVGKSTLANQLFGTQRSITADVPGTTRDWVGDWANIDGLAIQLLDTPGQRSTPDPIEHQAISRSRAEIESADLVILVLDPTQPKEPQDALRAAHRDAVLVLNKHDLPAKWNDPSAPMIQTIATKGDGIEALRQTIRARYVLDAPPRPAWWTQRQLKVLRRALDDPQSLNELEGA